jgi:DNA-binding NarL/FixJ family response regulator
MPRDTKKLRILIADDHEFVRRGVRGLLRVQRGWIVTGEAVNGREAVEKAKQGKPDVAIVDITMPILDGLEATRQIREAAPNTNVLIPTMHESDQMVRRVLEAGARGYVLKSDLAGHLVKAVKAVSQGKLFLTPKVSDIVLEGFLKAEKKPERTEHSQAQPTRREIEIIRLLAEVKSNKQAAGALGISVRTIETHRAKIMFKLGFHSISELVLFAVRNKIIDSSKSD